MRAWDPRLAETLLVGAVLAALMAATVLMMMKLLQ
jgi:hypothetical protein